MTPSPEIFLSNKTNKSAGKVDGNGSDRVSKTMSVQPVRPGLFATHLDTCAFIRATHPPVRRMVF